MSVHFSIPHGVMLAACLTCLTPAPSRALDDAAAGKAEEERLKAEKEVEWAAKERIAEYNKALGVARSSADVAAAIRTLDVKHPLIVNHLIQRLNVPDDETIFVAVVETFVKVDDPRCVPPLANTLLQRLRKPKDNVAVCIALVKALGHFGDRRASPAVAKALECTENPVAAEACTASPRVKDPVIVDGLIKLLRFAELPDYQTSGSGNASTTSDSYRFVNTRRELRGAAQKALQGVTGMSLGNAIQWKDWWTANRATWNPAAVK